MHINRYLYVLHACKHTHTQKPNGYHWAIMPTQWLALGHLCTIQVLRVSAAKSSRDRTSNPQEAVPCQTGEGVGTKVPPGSLPTMQDIDSQLYHTENTMGTTKPTISIFFHQWTNIPSASIHLGILAVAKVVGICLDCGNSFAPLCAFSCNTQAGLQLPPEGTPHGLHHMMTSKGVVISHVAGISHFKEWTEEATQLNTNM